MARRKTGLNDVEQRYRHNNAAMGPGKGFSPAALQSVSLSVSGVFVGF